MWRNTQDDFGVASLAFHWAIALLFLGQIVLGFVMTEVNVEPAWQFELFQWHKSLGFLIFALALPRLIWVLVNPAPKPAGQPGRFQEVGARLVKSALLALTIAVPFAGWAVVSTSTLQIPTYAFDLVIVPNLPLPPSARLEKLASEIHGFLAYAAGVLALCHIAAALMHHFVLRDRTLRRMLKLRHSDTRLGAGKPS